MSDDQRSDEVRCVLHTDHSCSLWGVGGGHPPEWGDLWGSTAAVRVQEAEDPTTVGAAELEGVRRG